MRPGYGAKYDVLELFDYLASRLAQECSAAPPVPASASGSSSPAGASLGPLTAAFAHRLHDIKQELLRMCV